MCVGCNRGALADDVNLVVDQTVPGRDGLDVLMLVHQRKPALLIIVLSARAEVADHIKALAPAQPTLWPSRSSRMSWWRGCVLNCAGAPGRDKTRLERPCSRLRAPRRAWAPSAFTAPITTGVRARSAIVRHHRLAHAVLLAQLALA